VKWETPRHGGHISLYIPEIHGRNVKIPSIVRNGERIAFEYDPINLRMGGSKFKNCWFPVKCERGNEIKRILNYLA
jgi:hypothetical protein